MSPKIQKERSFFCSELVACVYKRMGLLTIDKPSCSYWPGAFSTECVPETDKSLVLLEGNGNELSEEYQLIF